MRYVQALFSIFSAALSAHAGQLPGCLAIAGTEQLWSRPGIRFVIVGEMHGTAETPAIFRDLVCSARAARRPLIAGVEHTEQEAIDLFMASESHEAAVHNLLSKREWHQSDGKTSRAMLMLLEELRAFKLEGLLSGVVAFSDAHQDESGARREERMASVLIAAANRRPDALVIALTGNIHACKKTLPEYAP